MWVRSRSLYRGCHDDGENEIESVKVDSIVDDLPKGVPEESSSITQATEPGIRLYRIPIFLPIFLPI
jgi:hypothetical protein